MNERDYTKKVRACIHKQVCGIEECYGTACAEFDRAHKRGNPYRDLCREMAEGGNEVSSVLATLSWDSNYVRAQKAQRKWQKLLARYRKLKEEQAHEPTKEVSNV